METENKPKPKEEGSVVIAEAGSNAEAAATEDDELVLNVGDYLEFTAGSRVGTKGMIYYLDEELLRLLPLGVSDRLIDIDTTIFFEEGLEMERDPTSLDSFVEIVDLKEGNAVQTFDATGIPGQAYKVESVDIEEDSVVLKGIDADGNETGDVLQLTFSEDGRVRGIPREIDFAVIRPQEMPKPPSEEEEAPAPTENEGEEFNIQDIIDEPEPEPDAFVIREQRPEETIWDDIDQRTDFVENERAALKPAQRTNPRQLQRIRRLMENCYQLRNDICEYRDKGIAIPKPVTYQTLSSLLEETNFPLAKQVLKVYRMLYLDHSERHMLAQKEDKDSYEDVLDIGDPTLDINYLADAVDGGIEFLEREFGTSRPMEQTTLGSQTLPQMYQVFQEFYNTFYKSIGPITSNRATDQQQTKYDRDFFRLNPLPPTADTPRLRGLNHVSDKNSIVGIDSIRSISLSYMRTISSRIGKYGDRKVKLKGPVEQGDEAEVWVYILFPFLFLRDLGAIRSGKFSIDMGNGLSPPKTMHMILNESDGIQMMPIADQIFAIDPAGTTVGNIEVEEWLKGQSIYGNGIGDLLPFMKSIGLSNSEFTPQQMDVLQAKIQYYQANLKKFLKETREKANQILENPEPVRNFSFLSEADQAKFLEALYSNEPILQEKANEFQIRYPSWQMNDLGIFSYLYTHYPDYVIASLSGIPSNVAEERTRVTNDLFLERLHDKIEYDKKVSQEGNPPVINECEHVINLQQIRKAENDEDRIRLMVQKLLPMFAGETEDHWVMCRVCNGHLICEHEYLMILERTKPAQKDIIHKKILLTFSDGVFNGKFICGTCGQPIQDLEFDQTMEFDDEGRPMMGNEPITEEMQSTLEKELNNLLDIQERQEGGEGKRQKLKGENVDLANEIALKLGVDLPMETMRRVLELSNRLIQNRNFKEQKDYDKWLAIQKQKAKDAGQRAVFPTYDQYLNQETIAAIAFVLFLEIQSSIPEIQPLSVVPNCGDASFRGYPLNPSDQEVDGIRYLCCVLANLVRNEKPWSDTFWSTIAITKGEGFKNRTESIFRYMKSIIPRAMKEPEVETRLERKREFLRKQQGEQAITGRWMDVIPSDFLPYPIHLTKEKLENAEAPLIGDAATPSQKAYAWILEGHKLAKLNGVYQKGNPLSEATCCYSELEDPMKFWKDQTQMPTLAAKQPPLGPRGQLLTLIMKNRPPEHLLGEPNPTLMYRLFLRVCFPREGVDNPRVGLPHEPGYNNTCPYCGFVFPTDPRMPPPQLSYSKDKKQQELYDEEYKTQVQQVYQADISALQKAGVIEGQTVDKKAFQTLLQTTNKKFLIPSIAVKTVTTDIPTLQGLTTLNPEPFFGFKPLVEQLIIEVTGLKTAGEPTDSDIAVAYGPLSGKMSEFKTEMESAYKKSSIAMKELQLLVGSPPQVVGEMLRTFFLLPVQRALVGTFQPVKLRGSKEQKSYRKSIYKKVASEDLGKLDEYVEFHLETTNKILSELERAESDGKSDAVRAKLQDFVNKLTVVIPLFIKVLRTNVIPYGKDGLRYIQNAIVLGLFSEFIEPTALGSQYCGRILGYCLIKAQQPDENTIKTPEEIRKLITKRNESEKVEIINELDRMTPEQKRAELAMKSLGLGRWARGASKGIFSYDEEQQAFEAAERLRRGITDFYGLTPAEQQARDQAQGEEGGTGYDVGADDGEQ